MLFKIFDFKPSISIKITIYIFLINDYLERICKYVTCQNKINLTDKVKAIREHFELRKLQNRES